tara:strand:- start:85 stop:441 length:357 start_codon:yes stop_codon:yes gene_type:complete
MKGSKLKFLVKKAGIEEKDLEKDRGEWKSFISNLNSEEAKFAKLARKMLQNRGHANSSADRKREKISELKEKIKNLEKLVIALTSPFSVENLPEQPVPEDSLFLVDPHEIPDLIKNMI